MKKIREITRGTTKGFEVRITDNENPIEVDNIYFTLKNNCEVEEMIFQKHLGNGIVFKDNAYYIVINPEDTKDLAYGRYVFDIKIIKDGIKNTIEKGILAVTEEVTFACNEV